MDGGFIAAFFPFLSVSVPVSSVPVGLSFGVRCGLFLVAAVGTGCCGLFSTLTHDGKGIVIKLFLNNVESSDLSAKPIVGFRLQG